MDHPEDFQPPPTPGRPVSPPRADVNVEVLAEPVTPWIEHSDPLDEPLIEQSQEAQHQQQMQMPPPPPPQPQFQPPMQIAHRFRLGGPQTRPPHGIHVSQGGQQYRLGIRPQGPPHSMGLISGTRSQMQQAHSSPQMLPQHFVGQPPVTGPQLLPQHSAGHHMPQMHHGVPQMHQGVPQMHQGVPQMRQGVPQMRPSVHQSHPTVHQVPPQIHPAHSQMHQARPTLPQAGPPMHPIYPRGCPPQSMGPPHPMGPPRPMGPAQAPTTNAHLSNLSTLANNLPLPHHNPANSSSVSYQNSANSVIRHPPPQNQVTQQQIATQSANTQRKRYFSDKCHALYRSINELYEKYHSQLKHEKSYANALEKLQLSASEEQMKHLLSVNDFVSVELHLKGIENQYGVYRHICESRNEVGNQQRLVNPQVQPASKFMPSPNVPHSNSQATPMSSSQSATSSTHHQRNNQEDFIEPPTPGPQSPPRMDDNDEAPLLLPPTPRNPEPVHEPQVEETQPVKTESDLKPSPMQLALQRMRAKMAAKKLESSSVAGPSESRPNEQIIHRESNPAFTRRTSEASQGSSIDAYRNPSPPVIAISDDPEEAVLPSTSRDTDNEITRVLDPQPSKRTPKQTSFSSISSVGSNDESTNVATPVKIKEEPLEEVPIKENEQIFRYREHGMLTIIATKENLRQEFFLVSVVLPKWNEKTQRDDGEPSLILIRDYDGLKKIRGDDDHYIHARLKPNSSEIVLDFEVTDQVRMSLAFFL